ncbi:MAG: hypothetical protein EBU46_16415 [Nitrosomonadaceae bacterium]|nr:hypothetical protein [Nitrosomonadaceae bacterium]
MTTVTGNRNVLLGSGASLPNAAGDDQIAIGSLNATVYVKNALNAGAITASGVTLQGPLLVDAGGGGVPGAATNVLTSAGAGAPPIWQAFAPAGSLTGVTSTFTALGLETAVAATVSGVAVGRAAGRALTTGVNNVVVGPYAATNLAAGYDNVAIGAGAMAAAADADANSNVVIGSRAGAALTSSGCVVIALYVQGSLNYRWGTPITADITLPSPIAQLYLIGNAATAFSITLPSVALQHSVGAVVTFRRTGSSPQKVTFLPTAGDTLYPDHSTIAVASVEFGTNLMQTQFICNGAAWYQIFAT